MNHNTVLCLWVNNNSNLSFWGGCLVLYSFNKEGSLLAASSRNFMGYSKIKERDAQSHILEC